jgi:hypothetical protein
MTALRWIGGTREAVFRAGFHRSPMRPCSRRQPCRTDHPLLTFHLGRWTSPRSRTVEGRVDGHRSQPAADYVRHLLRRHGRPRTSRRVRRVGHRLGGIRPGHPERARPRGAVASGHARSRIQPDSDDDAHCAVTRNTAVRASECCADRARRRAPMTRLPGEHVVQGLYWSNRGEIACVKHAPDRDSPRWQQEEWTEVIAFIGSTPEYHCQHCYPWPVGCRPRSRQGQ